MYYQCPTKGNRLKIKYCEQKNIDARLADEIAWEWLYNILSDKELIADKIEEYWEERRKAVEPLKERLFHLDNMLEMLQSRYDKLIKMYLASDDFGQELMLPTKAELEGDIKKAKTERTEVQNKIDDIMIDYELHDMEDFCSGLPKWYVVATDYYGVLDYEDEELTFEQKRGYVEKYNLQATVITTMEGETYLHLMCDFGEAYRELCNNIYSNAQFPISFTLVFSDRLLLDFSSIGRFNQAVMA